MTPAYLRNIKPMHGIIGATIVRVNPQPQDGTHRGEAGKYGRLTLNHIEVAGLVPALSAVLQRRPPRQKPGSDRITAH